MALIEVSGLTFGYEGSDRTIFDNVSFRVDTGWKLGLVGRNGRGKSTLLRLLMGRHAHAGTIVAPVPLFLFPPDADLMDLTTVEAAGRLCPHAQPWQLARELSLLEAEESIARRRLASLSEGERVKALLAVLFLDGRGFPLIDEPTNHLDAHGRDKVGDYLRRKKGFILVSHDRTLLDSCVDHVLALNRADITIMQGNYSTWKENRDRQDAFEAACHEKLKKDTMRLAEAARRSAGWSVRAERTKFGHGSPVGTIDRGFIGHKSARMMKRAKALEARREKAFEASSALLRNVEEDSPLRMNPLRAKGSRLLEVAGLGMRREGRVLFSGLDFTLAPGDRLAVRGSNGCGKTSLLRLVAGEDAPHEGRVRRIAGLTLSVVPQDTLNLRGTPAELARQRGLDEQLFRAVLHRLGVPRELWREDMRRFSDGQRKKIVLAASMSESAHLYVWDEPLNFVDVISREQVEDVILACRPTMIFVEHDRVFAERVATSILDLSGQGTMRTGAPKPA